MNNLDLKNKFKGLIKDAAEKLKSKQVDSLIKEVKSLVVTIKEKPATQIITQVPHEINVANIKDVPSEVSVKNVPKEIKVSNFPEEIKIARPKWWKEPEKQKEIQRVEITNKSEKPAWLDSVIGGSFALLGTLLTDVLSKFFDVTTKFFVKLWNTGLTVRFDKPQQMVMIDPHTGQPIGKKDFAMGGSNNSHTFFNAAGRDPVGIKSATGQKINPATEDKQAPFAAVGHGNASVTTAGTPVALSVTSVPCKRVFVQSHESNGDLTNGGLVVVGGSGVSAASATRTGRALYPTNGEWFLISNLNLLHIDAIDNGAKIHYYYEN